MAGRISSSGSSKGALQDGPVDTKSSRATSRNSTNGGVETRHSARTSKTQHVEKGDYKDHLALLESIMRNEQPLSPALRSSHELSQRPSSQKQFPSNRL